MKLERKQEKKALSIILQIEIFQLNLKISLSGSKTDQSPASFSDFTINDEDIKHFWGHFRLPKSRSRYNKGKILKVNKLSYLNCIRFGVGVGRKWLRSPKAQGRWHLEHETPVAKKGAAELCDDHRTIVGYRLS